jgi:hypothetical protein
MCVRDPVTDPTVYLNWFGTAEVKEQGHPATASFIWAIAFYAF